VRLLNALYGIMKAALQEVGCILISIGFVLYLYNPCVANKIVYGKQL
jgi:hypothetical protein